MAAGSKNALSYPAKGTGNGAPQDRPQVLSSPAMEPCVRGLLPSYSGAGDPEPSITLSFPWEGQPSHSHRDRGVMVPGDRRTGAAMVTHATAWRSCPRSSGLYGSEVLLPHEPQSLPGTQEPS